MLLRQLCVVSGKNMGEKATNQKRSSKEFLLQAIIFSSYKSSLAGLRRRNWTRYYLTVLLYSSKYLAVQNLRHGRKYGPSNLERMDTNKQKHVIIISILVISILMIKIVIMMGAFTDEKIRRYLILTLSIFDYFIISLRFLLRHLSDQC